jgi:hypothetical protein
VLDLRGHAKQEDRIVTAVELRRRNIDLDHCGADRQQRSRYIPANCARVVKRGTEMPADA